MQRKPGFPVANCHIKMPDSAPALEASLDADSEQRRMLLINFGHAQWGFNHWSWSVTKQELDFVDFTNGKYCAGVVAFVSVTVKSLDIHRENIGYATSLSPNKGSAIYNSRKCAVTNALRETLLSFGGSVASELMELLESHKSDCNNPTAPPPPEPLPENNQNLVNKPSEPRNSPLNKNIRKDSTDSSSSNTVQNLRTPHPVPTIKNVLPTPPPVAKAHPMPANLPPAANRPPMPANAPRLPAPPPPHVRPNPNEASLEGMGDEEARAERKRRQRQAQEEFRQKQLMKQTDRPDEKQELQKNNSSIDKMLLEIPTQDIVIEETGDTAPAEAGSKRKSPTPEASASKRRAGFTSKLNIVTD